MTVAPASFARVAQAVASIRAHTTTEISHALVLGTGLDKIAGLLDIELELDYAAIDGMPVATATMHAGRLLIGELAGCKVAVLQGRHHLYEGWQPADVVLPVRVLRQLGAQRLIITNAAGALSRTLEPPQLMLITDHLNFTGHNPLVGPPDDRFGLRFPDMSNAYDAAYRARAKSCLTAAGVNYAEGIYAGVLGPSLETSAERRYLAGSGAAAVGMSTVMEVIAAVQAGYAVLGISAITNRADGGEDQPPDTLEAVVANAQVAGEDIMAVLPALLAADVAA